MNIKNALDELKTVVKGVYSYNFLRHFQVLPPTELQINITYWCNSRCQMCNIWKMRPKNELSFKEWQQILKDPIFSSIERLFITGGEPMLHHNIVKLAELFLKSMPKLKFVDLTSNGFIPLRTVTVVEEIIKLTKKRGINFSVTISIDAVGKLHDEIREIPGGFKQAWNTVILLKNLQKKYNFGLGVAGVIMRKNLYEIEKLENFCLKHKVPFYYQIVGFRDTYVQNMEKKEELDFRKKDEEYLFTLLERLAKVQDKKNIKSYIRSYYWKDMFSMYKEKNPRTTPCPFLLDAFSLDSLGDVYYCLSQRKIGNCRYGKSVSDIYYDKRNIDYRKRMANNFCLRCNSGCFVTSAIAKDFKKILWYFLTDKLGSKGTH